MENLIIFDVISGWKRLLIDKLESHHIGLPEDFKIARSIGEECRVNYEFLYRFVYLLLDDIS